MTNEFIQKAEAYLEHGGQPDNPISPTDHDTLGELLKEAIQLLKGVDPERGSVRTTIGDGEDEFGVTITWDGGGIGIDVDGFKDINDLCIVYVGAWDGAPEAIIFPDINDEEPLTIKFHDAAAHLYRVDDPPYTGWNLVRETIEHHTPTHKKDDPPADPGEDAKPDEVKCAHCDEPVWYDDEDGWCHKNGEHDCFLALGKERS